jgi:hypothetical protein
MYLVGRDLEHLSYKLLELRAGVVWHGDCQRYPKSAGGEEGGCRVDASMKVGMMERGRKISTASMSWLYTCLAKEEGRSFKGAERDHSEQQTDVPV